MNFKRNKDNIDYIAVKDYKEVLVLSEDNA